MLLDLVEWLERERAHIGDAGIVDEAVERPALQRLGDSGHCGLDLVGLCDIEDQRGDIPARLLQGLAIGMLAHAREDFPAIGGEVFGSGPANAG